MNGWSWVNEEFWVNGGFWVVSDEENFWLKAEMRLVGLMVAF